MNCNLYNLKAHQSTQNYVPKEWVKVKHNYIIIIVIIM